MNINQLVATKGVVVHKGHCSRRKTQLSGRKGWF